MSGRTSRPQRSTQAARKIALARQALPSDEAFHAMEAPAETQSAPLPASDVIVIAVPVVVVVLFVFIVVFILIVAPVPAEQTLPIVVVILVVRFVTFLFEVAVVLSIVIARVRVTVLVEGHLCGIPAVWTSMATWVAEFAMPYLKEAFYIANVIDRAEINSCEQ
eukprot:CAMPEP_0114493080 /NCGR_PEP_ID=MMETSP0109-20121206/3914_1 /TAXON_ID=29199 /ORGANISM="Chlorarachnion reptans, Strain CCCM449" /LENGTH=163 /DNA_ID=CAMNT_0001669999 /DNA_START=645 /DNA_END=1137 /DNA_ORIENTATION=-